LSNYQNNYVERSNQLPEYQNFLLIIFKIPKNNKTILTIQ